MNKNNGNNRKKEGKIEEKERYYTSERCFMKN